MSLYSYLARLGDILHARQDIVIENLQIILTTAGAILQARLRFYDHSALIVVEEVEKAGCGMSDALPTSFITKAPMKPSSFVTTTRLTTRSSNSIHTTNTSVAR